MQIQKAAISIFIILVASLWSGCKKDSKVLNNSARTANNPIRYIPFGDSYTAGHGADPDQAYPVLLVNDLNKYNIPIKMIVNEGLGGHTTEQAMSQELPVFDTSHATFVSILLGANDWSQYVDTATFRSNYKQMIDDIRAKLPNKTNILIITIPDISATPGGRSQANGRNIVQDITNMNNIIKQEANHFNLPLADIFPLSQKMRGDPTLIASDSLHPSAKEYARWEQFVILPVARKMLK